MGRPNRRNHPGVPFHLTARTQGREPLFDGLEQQIIDAMVYWSGACGVPLLAYAIMHNHLHLVAVQGHAPLGAFMKPLLTAVARGTNRALRREGHVFERRYSGKPCLDADYLRTAIAYVHLNPVRAGMCQDAGQYSWTSHRLYCNCSHDETPACPRADLGLRLFAMSSADLVSARVGYASFLNWRIAMTNYRDADPEEKLALPSPPNYREGDRFWIEEWAHHIPAASGPIGRDPMA